jgi:hypothetical protein
MDRPAKNYRRCERLLRSCECSLPTVLTYKYSHSTSKDIVALYVVYCGILIGPECYDEIDIM